MKKAALLSTLLLVAGCAGQQNADEQVILSELSVPCSYSCMAGNECSQAVEPMVLKPRVWEVKQSTKVRRCCAEDEAEVARNIETYIPAVPEIYVISANRTVNSMLRDTAEVFAKENLIKVYVAETKVDDPELPEGYAGGIKTIKNRLDNSNNMTVVNSEKQADYVLNTEVSWFDTETKKVPAVKYNMVLNSTDGVKIGEWSEVVHQTAGDRSWW